MEEVMFVKSRSLIVMISLLALFATQPLHAGAGSAVTKLAKRIVAKEGTKEVAETALSRSMTNLARQHGDDVVKRILKETGEEGISFAERHGNEAVIFLSRYGKRGIAIASREGTERVLAVTRAFGPDAVTVIEKHPGVGLKILEQGGAAGRDIALRYDTATVINTLNVMEKAASYGETKEGVLAGVSQYGKDYFKSLGKWTIENPQVPLYGGAAALVWREKEKIKDLLTPPPQLLGLGIIVVMGLVLWWLIKREKRISAKGGKS